MAKLPHLIKKKAIENGAVDGEIIKLLEGQAIKAVDGGVDVDLVKVESGKVKVLGSEVELKSSSESKLAEAKAYADQVKSDIMGGLPAQALDTIKELADAIQSDESIVQTVISNVSSISSALTQAQSDFNAALSAEQSARESADSNLQTQINNAVGNASSDFTAAIAQEVSDRQAADSVLDGKITTEKNRAESAESQIAGDLSLLSTFVNELNISRQTAESNLDSKITTEKNRAEGVEASLSSSISSEVSARQAADSALESALTSAQSTINSAISSVNAALVQEISDRQSADSAKLLEAKQYADGKITDLINGAPAMLDTLKEIADAIASGDSVATSLASQLSSEISRAEGEEQRIEGKVDAEVLARQAAISSVESSLSSAQSSFTSALNSEISSRQSADSALSSDIAAKLVEAKSYTDSKVSQEVIDRDAAILVEKNRAEAAEAAKLVEAKSYTDSSISTLQSAVTAAITSEATDRTSADNALDARLDVIEAMSFGKEKLTVGGSVPSTFQLAQLAHSNSIMVFVGAIPLHEGVGEGYTVTTSGGKSVINFNTDALATGDKVFFYYHY